MVGSDVQLHRSADKSLQQRVVQILRDARALGEPLLEPDVQPARDLVHAQAVEAGGAEHEGNDTPDAKPRRLPHFRRDRESDCRFNRAPLPFAVRRLDAKAIRPGREIGIDGFARGDGRTPVAVEAVEAISEPHALGYRQAQPGVGKCQPVSACRNADVVTETERRAIGRNTHHVRDRRHRSASRPRWIDHGQPAPQRKPDARAVGDDRTLPAHALDTPEAVEQAVLAHGVVRSIAAQQLLAVDAQDAIQGRDPDEAAAISGQAGNRLVEARRQDPRRCDTPARDDGNPRGRPNPHDPVAIGRHTRHVVRRQSVINGKALPLAAAESAHTAWRAEPHSSVTGLRNRSDRVRGETVDRCQRREAAALQYADATAQRARPHRTAPPLVHHVDAVLRQSVRLRVGGRCPTALPTLEVRKTATLPAQPDVTAAAGNRVDQVSGCRAVCDTLDATALAANTLRRSGGENHVRPSSSTWTGPTPSDGSPCATV